MSYFLKQRTVGGTALFLTGKKQKTGREDAFFLLFFLVMAVYYGARMLILTPWYDELYTYFYFISRGPVYAALHWPLPNNHVGYSTISACLGIFGSAPVALRGVSCLCSLANLCLLYRISKKWFTGSIALVPVLLFAGMYAVNQLAVQGRGYALVTCCYLTALLSLWRIVEEKKDNKRYYIAFCTALVVSLWAVPSSLYVVVPICLTGGFTLLLEKDYKRLLRLVAVSLVGAVVTAGLYGLLWLAIGSNLLTKTPGGPFYMAGHIHIILHAPFRALSEGISYMLSSPYIQSMTRQEFWSQAWHWLTTLFGIQLAPMRGLTGNGMCVLLTFGLAAAVVCVVRRPKKAYLEWYFLLTAATLTLTLLIQCKLPYQRVFSFLGVWAALLAGWLVQKCVLLIQNMSTFRLRDGAEKTIKAVALIAVCIFWVIVLMDMTPYSMREDLAREAYEQADIGDTDVCAVTDCDQEYLLLYLYGDNGVQTTRNIEEADIVLLDKALLGLPYGHREAPEEWKFYLSKEETDGYRPYIEENMAQVYENQQYVMYRRK